MYKSLVFGDEFLAQGLHLKSHQRCSAGIRTWLGLAKSFAYYVSIYISVSSSSYKWFIVIIYI